MSAPSDTVWGDIHYNSNGEGRIGIDVSWENISNTTTRCYMDVWYWSKYKVQDSVNYFDVCVDGAENWFTAVKNKAISTPSNSEWSTDNQVYIGQWTIDRDRTTSPQTFWFATAFGDIEYGGGSGYCYAYYSIPALPQYTITYNGNGDNVNGVPSPHSYYYGYDTSLYPYGLMRTGYDFLGWSLSSTSTSASYQPGQAWSGYNASNYTLYAVWKIKSYTWTYDANGGENAPASQTGNYGTGTIMTTEIPTRKDYKFLGWATSPTATEPDFHVGWTSTIVFYFDRTLYAVWQLDYIRPRINNLSVTRCNADMVNDDYGNYAKIVFDWETDRTGNAYAVYVVNRDVVGEVYSYRKELTELSGHVEELITDSAFNVLELSSEYEFDIQLNVADNNGHSTEYRMINSAFIPVDFTENMKSVSFGEPCPEEDGLMRFAFDRVDIAPKENLLYKGEKFFGAKQIWTGQEVMNELKSITLSKKISEMKNGILLVFARGTYNLTPYFVPKEVVLAYTRTTFCFPLCTGMLDYIGSKTLNISDTKIEGHTDNDATGTNGISGITYHNELFYLVKIYEV